MWNANVERERTGREVSKENHRDGQRDRRGIIISWFIWIEGGKHLWIRWCSTDSEFKEKDNKWKLLYLATENKSEALRWADTWINEVISEEGGNKLVGNFQEAWKKESRKTSVYLFHNKISIDKFEDREKGSKWVR